VAFVLLTLIAILSAIVPASRAAALTPVEALRYER
jgi:ABC-type lipoprotein release transport system permease subunit